MGEYLEELRLHMIGGLITLIEGFDTIQVFEVREVMNYLRKKIKYYEGMILHEQNVKHREIQQNILNKAKQRLTHISRYKRRYNNFFENINTFDY